MPYMKDYKISRISGDGQVTLESNTLRLQKIFALKLALYSHSQHDGRPWGEEFVAEKEDELIEEIMQEMRSIVTDLVRDTNIYSIHS